MEIILKDPEREYVYHTYYMPESVVRIVVDFTALYPDKYVRGFTVDGKQVYTDKHIEWSGSIRASGE